MVAQKGRHAFHAQFALQEADHVAVAFALALHVRAQNFGHVARCLRHREGEKAVRAAAAVIGDGVQILPAFAHDKAILPDAARRVAQPGKERLVFFAAAGVVAGHRVQAEAVHAHVQPVAQDALDFCAHLGAIEVEVGHGGNKAAFVIASVRQRGIAALRLGLKVVVLPVGRRIALAGALEPGMLVGGVVDHQVDDHADAQLMRPCQKRLKIFQGAVFGMDVVVVGHVVFVVTGGGMDGHEPDAAKAHGVDVIQLFRQPLEIPDAVAVAVGKGIDENLVPVVRGLRLGGPNA